MHYSIDFIITKRCNLNCKYCTSRASICTTDCEYDLTQFKRDVDHFFDIGMDFTPILIGGEPFCNKIFLSMLNTYVQKIKIYLSLYLLMVNISVLE